MISLMILLAFFNGLLVVTTRVINAKLGLYVSGAGASFWNHFVGWLFLMLIVPILSGGGVVELGGIPLYLYLGGLIGAGYVVINNIVIPKVGATRATILIIAGQIVLGTWIDVVNGRISNLSMTLFGITLLIMGMWLGNLGKSGQWKQAARR